MKHDFDWLSAILHQNPKIDAEKINVSMTYARELTEKNPSINQTLAIHQSTGIAKQLLALESDTQMLCAALLYPFVTLDESTRLFISTKLDPTIYKLLQGVKRMEAIDHLALEHNKPIPSQKQLDHLSGMLLAIVDDARIVLIKLSERLNALMELRHAPSEKQKSAATQIMALYAPLANRLGVGHIKWQLEDWSFRYLDPENYAAISKELKQRREDRERYVQTIQHELEKLINASDIEKYQISGRAKHIYSIYRKIQRKHQPFEKIYDSNAFRILVPTVEDCYRTLSLIHAHWPHIQPEFDDYIARPKQNGYQSIHTVISDPHHRYAEIQIRTFDMHAQAELGVAAHWKYKEDKKTAEGYQNKIALLRDIMGWQRELSESGVDRNALYSKLFEDRVYVFTPQNQILDLARGATPLDAAYHIHTELGHRCRGAKVNHKIVPLTHPVKTGDVIEIITGTTSRPSRDWLNPDRGYLKTKIALNKVKNWFARQFREEKLAKGEALWEKLAKREGVTKNHLDEILRHYKFKTIEDLLIALGSGNISVHSLTRQLKPDVTIESDLTVDKDYSDKVIPSGKISIAGTESLLTQLARCCQPIPGDKIVGYITKGRGICIHRETCKNLKQAKKIRPERILEISWGASGPHRYPLHLDIEAIDHPAIIRDISAVITGEHLPLLGLHSQVDTLQGRCYIKLTIEIQSTDSLKRILQHLRQLPQVVRVERG